MPARKIAFYAPLKPPTHPSPSGDRQMARLLLAALRLAGHEVELASELKTYLPNPDAEDTCRTLIAAAEIERQEIDAEWKANGPPDLWVSYHPYYKSPDLLGPPLCRAHGVPWITIEASLSARRSIGHWADLQAYAQDAVEGARTNVSLTGRDALGLWEIVPDVRTTRVSPFIDAAPYLDLNPQPEANHLVTVAMMRPGDKLDSFTMLARALGQLHDMEWHLTIVGDGPARGDVETLFTEFPDRRLTWAGKLDETGVRDVLSRGSLLAWPGSGEAYGLSYLEAQGAGLPVVAQDTAGVPEVVSHGVTGILTPAGDVTAYSEALRRLMTDDVLRGRLAQGARDKVRSMHSLQQAARCLAKILDDHVWDLG